MCLWVSYKEKYEKIIIFLHPFCTASYWQSCGAQVPYMMLFATNMLVPRCGGSGIGFSADPDPDPAFFVNADPDPDPAPAPRF
jgi:hypothetical protein